MERPPYPTLFPYTTLFRSRPRRSRARRSLRARRRPARRTGKPRGALRTGLRWIRPRRRLQEDRRAPRRAPEATSRRPARRSRRDPTPGSRQGEARLRTGRRRRSVLGTAAVGGGRLRQAPEQLRELLELGAAEPHLEQLANGGDVVAGGLLELLQAGP